MYSFFARALDNICRPGTQVPLKSNTDNTNRMYLPIHAFLNCSTVASERRLSELDVTFSHFLFYFQFSCFTLF